MIEIKPNIHFGNFVESNFVVTLMYVNFAA